MILVVLVALAGLASVHSASGPIRAAAERGRPTCRRSSCTCSRWRPIACRRSTSSSPSSAHCSASPSASTPSTASARNARCRDWLSQPIHRDEVINGKFVAGLGAIALALASVMLIVVGYGMLRLGIGPTIGEVVRMIAFFVVAVVYIALWLALAMVLSVVTRRAATAALAAIAIWLVFTLFGGLIAGLVADTVHPVPAANPTTEEVLDNARLEQNVQAVLAVGALPGSDRRVVESVAADDRVWSSRTTPTSQALPSTLSLSESLVLAWWQVAALVGGVVVLFAGAYARLHAPRGPGLIAPARPEPAGCSGNRMTNVVGAVDTSSTRPPSGRSRFLARSRPRPWPR